MRILVTTSPAGHSYDTAAIMRAAWAAYDRVNCGGDRKRFKFNRVFFAQMLAAMWKQAREQMETAKLAALPVGDKATRRTELQNQLTRLNYLPVGMNASRRAAVLKDKISQLAA